jgi:hypothetical protein
MKFIDKFKQVWECDVNGTLKAYRDILSCDDITIRDDYKIELYNA